MKHLKTAFTITSLVATLGIASMASSASLGTLAIPFDPGTGNSNTNFMIDTNSELGIEIGIKAKGRFTGDLPATSAGVYSATAGEGDPGLALWNFDYSIDVGEFSSLSEYDVFLSIDFDPAVGNTNIAIFDVNLSGASGESLVQDSQNLGFSFWSLLGVPNAGGFDPNATGEYSLGLDVLLKGTSTSLATTSALVSVTAAPAVPLPAGLPLAVAGLGLLWATGRRRKI
ncbi:MAG: hypothetical protein ABJL99_08460 [Aliishimia sp.]